MIRYFVAAAALALAAVSAQAQTPETLSPVATRDAKVVRRWSLPGDPRAVAIGKDGTIYAGLAEPQAVIAVDPKSGAVLRRVVLDSAEIASTKELVTMRVTADGTRLAIANGSDESATILSLPDLAVVREITMEGETIRDVLPDPRGRFLYVLGRKVHVFDYDGQTELRTLKVEAPMAIATTSSGSAFAVLAPEDFGNGNVTTVALFDPANKFAEIASEPMQTDQVIDAALFAANDRALVAMSRDSIFEKALVTQAKQMASGANGSMRMTLAFGDFVNSNKVCLPEGSGTQILTTGAASDQLYFAERRCSAAAAFSGSDRKVTLASLYNVSAYALAYHAATNTLVATDRAGFLTIYKVPRAAVVR